MKKKIWILIGVIVVFGIIFGLRHKEAGKREKTAQTMQATTESKKKNDGEDKKTQNMIIEIDPGHGGNQPGA